MFGCVPASAAAAATPDSPVEQGDFERAWRKAQARLARLTPHAVHVTAKRSSHYVMFTQPKLIVDQVRRVVRVVRRGQK